MCSQCAASEPSVVATVQRSGSCRVSGEPAVIIGSMASVIPADQLRALAGPAVVGDVRVHVHLGADAVAAVAGHDAVAAGGAHRGLDRVGDVGEPATDPGGRDAVPQRGPAGLRQRRGPGPTAPTPTVTAASPCQPSTIAPKSSEIRSPSASTSCRLGMPCTMLVVARRADHAGNGGGPA